MGLLSNLADNLLPRQRRGRRGGGGRPLIDMPEFSAGDVGYVGAGLNALSAVPYGALNNTMQAIDTAMYSVGGVSVNLGGQYKMNVLSAKGIVDAVVDPNKAAATSVMVARDIIGQRKGNVWTSGYKWKRFVNGLNDFNVKMSIRGSSLNADDKNDLLSIMNAEAGFGSKNIKKEGRNYLVSKTVSDIKAKGVDSAVADRFGQLLNDLDDVSVRRRVYRQAGATPRAMRGNFSNRKARLANALAKEVSGDKPLADLLMSEHGELLVGSAEGLMSSPDKSLLSAAFEAKLHELDGKGGDSALVAKRLRAASQGSKSIGVINQVRSVLYGQLAQGNLTRNILNGEALLWFESSGGRWFGGRFFAGAAKFDMDKMTSKAGLGTYLYLLHPGSLTRMLWDGDWFKMADRAFFKGEFDKTKFYKFIKDKLHIDLNGLKDGLIRGSINNIRDVLIKQVGLKDLINSLEKIDPLLAEKVQKAFSMGLDEFARSWVKGAIKQAFKKVGESVAKLLTKVGLKKLGEIIGTAILPVIGTFIGWVVGEIVWVIVDSFMWKLLEFVIQLLFLVIAIIIVVIMMVTGILYNIQNMYPVMILPGQSMNTYNPQESGEDEYGQEYQGGLGNVVNAESIDSGEIMPGQYCTQGYKGATSHLPYYPGTLALDISNGIAQNAIVYSPVDGVVDGIFRGTTSLDKIVIKSNEPVDNPIYFHMTHIDADTCRFAKGDSVAKGDSLCTLFYSPTAIYATNAEGEYIYDSKGNKILRWSGTHVHIRANNNNGAVANLHELIGLPGIDPETCN